MKRTVLILLLLAALAATISGTVAYFTDSVEAQGNLASANLDIVQHEYERATVNGSTTIRPYTQKQVIYPCVVSSNASRSTIEVNGKSVQLYNLEGMRNFVDKIVTVENTGTTNIYLRTFVAVPAYYYTDTNSVSWLHLDLNQTDWYWAQEPIRRVTIGGICYDIYYGTSTSALAPGAYSAPSLLGFYLDGNVSQKQDQYIYKAAEGNINLGTEAAFSILVATEASQADVFQKTATQTAAEVAMENTYGTPSTGRHPWLETKIAENQTKLDELLISDLPYNTYIALKKGSYTLPSVLPNGLHLFALDTDVNVKATNNALSGYDIELDHFTFTENVTLSGHGSYTNIEFKNGFTAAPSTGAMLIDSCTFDTYKADDTSYQVLIRNCSYTNGQPH